MEGRHESEKKMKSLVPAMPRHGVKDPHFRKTPRLSVVVGVPRKKKLLLIVSTLSPYYR